MSTVADPDHVFLANIEFHRDEGETTNDRTGGEYPAKTPMSRWHAAEGSDNFSGRIYEQRTETKTGMEVITSLFLKQYGSIPVWIPYPGCPGAQEPETAR